jgi:hypothetical protein
VLFVPLRAQCRRIDDTLFSGKLAIGGTPALADFLGVETFDGFHQRLG